MEINLTEPQTETRLTWSKPQIVRLNVSLDTANSQGSAPDAENGSPVSQ